MRSARRLALAKAGLLKPEWTGLPSRGGRGARRQRATAHTIIQRFGYLQLDTVSVAGARSHGLVLLSRLEGFDAALGERLLQPGEPLFEYWGHEASWMPIEMYPLFQFRREGLRRSRYWKHWMHGQRAFARDILQRVRDEGPIRSADLDGRGEGGWWGHKPAKRVVVALWWSGDLAIRERSNFQRTFDLPERVIPDSIRSMQVGRADAVRALIHRALNGHGWATVGTLASTWRFRNMRHEIDRALADLQEAGIATPCALEAGGGRTMRGWIQAADLELAERLRRVRPDPSRAVLLSPFDPVLWDRGRVAHLFGFDQLLEIFKPVEQRRYGYFCLPVLAADRLIARVDLKADRSRGEVHVLSCRFESTGSKRAGSRPERAAVHRALLRHHTALNAKLRGWRA
jgi:uncharacterized protein YcaQ